MSYSEPRCYIHHDREAVEKCEKCNKLICVSCKTKYRSHGGMDRSDDIYIYCPPCYTNREKQATKLGKIICPLFILFFVGAIIIMGIMLLGFLDAMSNMPSFP